MANSAHRLCRNWHFFGQNRHTHKKRLVRNLQQP